MRIFAPILLILALSTNAFAQRGDYWFGFAYNVSIPSGDVRNFIDQTSFRGVSMEGRKLIKDNVSFGFMAGWNVLNKETNEVVSLRDNLDIQGFQLRYINSFPIMLNSHYYFGQGGGIRPYVGLNAGTYIIEQRVEIAAFLFDDSNWHFGLAPEVGVTFPLGWRVAGFGMVRYNYAFSSGGTGAIQYWGINLGVAWR